MNKNVVLRFFEMPCNITHNHHYVFLVAIIIMNIEGYLLTLSVNVRKRERSLDWKGGS